MTIQEIEQGYIRHATLTQLHRWYQVYENSEIDIANQLDILSQDIKLKSGLGEATGHEAYKTRISQLPKTWQNAHFVRHPKITFEDTSIQLELDITYLNVGMKPDGSVRSAELHYSTKLEPTDTVLPRFSSIEITQLNESLTDSFKPAYADNRLLSLVHYWLTLTEDPARNPEPVKEILADTFVLNFSSGAITDFEGFKAWLAGPGSQVRTSTHELSNFSRKELGNHHYSLQVDFAWQGILPTEAQMVVKTRHTWAVIDNPKERFARIQRMDVEVLEPFTLI
jgi:hypothetical protein